MRKLESQLTAEMSKPPAQWNMEVLRQQATAISISTNDVRERGHAERLKQKIQNCETIRANYGSAFSSTQNNNTNISIDPKVVDRSTLEQTYDAHGWLNQLVSSNGRLAPAYVLEDETGKIIYHIAPSPGLNLNRYLKQRVGIKGRKGFHQRLKLNHVTAERVVAIDKLR